MFLCSFHLYCLHGQIEEERQAAESLRRQLQEYTDHITKLEQKLAQVGNNMVEQQTTV
ncbi:hypothetical protein DPMN_129196 [Dreissena polymorpha]|uniref:Uncharacterized protein n=1 Tax=Dreissena polymorpha TaxID=45954 RepID=A0A9D4H483_DREPO|nr:hypothetical protein DPMN_129196 [Dreissena polymorpha]